jgi:hypothetical protein
MRQKGVEIDINQVADDLTKQLGDVGMNSASHHLALPYKIMNLRLPMMF